MLTAKNHKIKEYGGLIVSVIYVIFFFVLLNLLIALNRATDITWIAKNSVMVSFLIVWLITCLQGILRLKTCDGMRYEMMKFNNFLKLGSIRQQQPPSFEEYQIKSSSYRQQTRWYWWMNFSLYGVGSLVSVIVTLV